MEAQSPNHWTAREFPKGIFKLIYFGVVQRIFLKTNAGVNIKRKRVTIEVATVSVILGRWMASLDTLSGNQWLITSRLMDGLLLILPSGI